MSLVVAKIGSSSVTTLTGAINSSAIAKLCGEVAGLRKDGHRAVIVTSGAIAAGMPPLGLGPVRPARRELLRAAAAVGQIGLFRAFEEGLSHYGLLAGQVLLAPTDLMERHRYLGSRETLIALLDLGVVPIVNENDAIADDEIKFGDNDRLSALVANLVDADQLVLLTDTPGLFTADPRRDAHATLIEEIAEIDAAIEMLAGGTGSLIGSGGMASKLAAAKMATWSGVNTLIAAADRDGVLGDSLLGIPGIGTVFPARNQHLSARRVWIAFAVPARGTVFVDAGARVALTERGRSLLAAGVVGVDGDFDADDPVDIAVGSGAVFAKGLASWPSEVIAENAGRRTSETPDGLADAVVHRDRMVLLPALHPG
jgi:glutamate 5-kinase